jgi:GNAT superfamily N-acetyltransferase
MTLEIRPAAPADIAVLAAFIRALAAHHGETATITETRLQRILFGAARQGAALIAVEDGEPAGFAAIVPLVRLNSGERGSELQHLFVREKSRGRGIGRALVAAAQAQAQAQGHSWLAIGTKADNRAAQNAYRAMGLEDLPPPGPRFVRHLGNA